MKQNQPNHSTRLCCVCDSILIGRSDKVFCSVKCKNTYHKSIRKHAKNVMSTNFKILQKNYLILCSLLGTNCSKFEISKLKLQELQFDFNMITGLKINSLGQKKEDYIFEVFEFNWKMNDSNTICVTHNLNHSQLSPFMYKRWERQLKPQQTEKIINFTTYL